MPPFLYSHFVLSVIGSHLEIANASRDEAESRNPSVVLEISEKHVYALVNVVVAYVSLSACYVKYNRQQLGDRGPLWATIPRVETRKLFFSFEKMAVPFSKTNC